METLIYYLVLASFILWIIVLFLPWQPWSTREQWDSDATEEGDLEDVTVLIPARNEGNIIGRTLPSVFSQGKNLNIILIDDSSTDDTASRANQFGKENLTLLSGKPLPERWSGKLWALEQGRLLVNTPFLLLLDADIELREGLIAGLRRKMISENLPFVSLLAWFQLEGFWEKMLMPAFIYFFKLVYPFRLSNSNFRYVAAAAGGCIMMRTEVLEKIGGFEPIKEELIDDCSLARQVKRAGFRTWLGLTHSVKSIRPYKQLSDIWNMVARTAFNQLNYSLLLLLGCSALLIIAYALPLFWIFYPEMPTRLFSAAAYLLLMITYLPVLRFYKLSIGWALLLPFIGLLFMLMTWTSAFRYHKGEKVRWRGRIVQR